MVKFDAPNADPDDEVRIELVGRDLADLRRPTRAEDRLADALRKIATIADRSRHRIEIGDARGVRRGDAARGENRKNRRA